MDDGTASELAQGFVPMIRAEGDVSLREAGALVVVAGGNASINEGGAGSLIAGGDVTLSQAGSGSMLVVGNAELRESGVGQMFTVEATVTDSRIGVLLAGRASIAESQILLGTQQAIGFGVAAGATVFLLGRLLRRH